MVFSIKTRIEGMDALLATVNLLKQGARNSVLRPAVGAAARLVAKSAKQNVAAKVKRRTGLLQKSIGSLVRVGRRTGSVYAIVGPRTGFKQVHPQHGNVDPIHYAHLVENGTTAHEIPIAKGPFAGITVHHPGTSPKPFLRPALEDNRQRIRNVMAQTIMRGLEKLAAKSLKRGYYARAAFAGTVAQAFGGDFAEAA